MSRVCDNCQKSYIRAVKRKKTRSKYNPVNHYHQKVNLHTTVIDRKRMKLCTSCYRKLLVRANSK